MNSAYSSIVRGHSWARSTKTRIETNNTITGPNLGGIREQDPLKQGLKHILHERTGGAHIREQDPLKQGLKPPL